MATRENFSFRPLTKGLGLQQEEAKKRESKNRFFYRTTSTMEMGANSERERLEDFHSPFQREQGGGPGEPEPTQGPPLEEPARGPSQRPSPRPRFTSEKDNALSQGLQKGIFFKPAFFTFSSFFLDLCVSFSLTLYTLCVAFLIVQWNNSPLHLLSVLPSLSLLSLCLWLGTHFIYSLLCHCFLGATLGEFAYRVQLGTNYQFRSPFYAFRVLWRYTLMFLTGCVVLPLFSWALRADLLGYLSGLSLWKRKEIV